MAEKKNKEVEIGKCPGVTDDDGDVLKKAIAEVKREADKIEKSKAKQKK